MVTPFSRIGPVPSVRMCWCDHSVYVSIPSHRSSGSIPSHCSAGMVDEVLVCSHHSVHVHSVTPFCRNGPVPSVRECWCVHSVNIRFATPFFRNGPAPSVRRCCGVWCDHSMQIHSVTVTPFCRIGPVPSDRTSPGVITVYTSIPSDGSILKPSRCDEPCWCDYQQCASIDGPLLYARISTCRFHGIFDLKTINR